ncbi:MAG: hypothetical protein HYV96_14570 [Opitutae bacterium]|nr:hypothetical protein [Opitutae bacterium]
MKIAAAVFLWLLAAVVVRAEVERTWHVAPAPIGADGHDGSAEAPFVTLERARLAVRAYLAERDVRGDLVVEVRAGEYELPAPLRFDAADSGENGGCVIYRAVPGARVVLSGGRHIEGWTVEPDGTQRATVGRAVDFRQLWVNGRRAVRARTPNAGLHFQLADEKQRDGFDLPRDVLAGVNVRPAEIEMSVLVAWMHKRLRIARVTPAGDATVRAVIAGPEWDGITKQPQGDRVYRGRSYWLENAREFLDAPGEFFLDRADGVVRYRPRAGETLERGAVIRPELESLVVLAGTLSAPVHDLRFEGLTLAHTGWTRPNRHGFVDVQANSLVPADPAAAVDPQYRHNQRKDRIPGAIHATTADRIAIRGCRFARLGGAGVVFTGGGNDNVVEGNSFFDLSAGAVEFGEDAARPVDRRLIPRRNRVANNFIARIGEEYFGSVAILGYYTSETLVAHNEIAGIPYTAISAGWGWGNPPAPPETGAVRIVGNRITNYLRRVDDGGGIYTTDRLPRSEIAFNFIDRMLPPDRHTKAGGALYLDQFTEGVEVHDNVVTDAIRWLFIWNPNIRGNRVVANFADTAALRNDGTGNAVEPAQLLSLRPWPSNAEAILAAAGIEPAFASAREFDAPDDVIVDGASVEFQPVSEGWAATASPSSYSGVSFRAASDSLARWTPALPKAGVYEVSAWRSPGDAAEIFLVRHRDGSTSVKNAARAGARGGWEKLGEFPFDAGLGAEVEAHTRRANALRFRFVHER